MGKATGASRKPSTIVISFGLRSAPTCRRGPKPVVPSPMERWAEFYRDEPRTVRGGAMLLGAVIVAGLVLSVTVTASTHRDCADAVDAYVERALVCVMREAIINPRPP
jgi:hypothetical protein